ncbi:MAG: copper-translocating P-type ATPase [Clostridiales bacterium]|nr:MAG: copper-translocating P-type ATPase [Clostridiales bacterium]
MARRRGVLLTKKKFSVTGMSCAACSAAVEKAVGRLDGVESAQVNLLAKSMVCVYDESKTGADAVIAAVEKAGFGAAELAERERTAEPKKEKAAAGDGFTAIRTRLWVSIVFLALLMYVSMGHMLGLPLPGFLHGTQNALPFAFLQFLLTLPVLYVNRKFYFNGFRALAHRAPNMDSLVAVGSAAAMLYGVIAIFMIGAALGRGDWDTVERYRTNLYFESAAMILTLVTVGKFLEERSKGKTGAAIAKLLDLSPKTATVLRDGEERVIPAEEILTGDVVLLKPGERVPVDGVVLEGSSAVDQSALTGESIPVTKDEGKAVMSASVNMTGFLKIRATRVGQDTTLARIVALVEEASSSKAPISKLADKVSGIFVPAVMAIAVVAGAAWLLAGRGVEDALNACISVLVISCPCALGLATPVAIMVSTGRCAQMGILIKSAEALELLHAADTVVLDKTGTITVGKPSVTDVVECASGRLLPVAAALEKKSGHPLADAVVRYAADAEPAEVSAFTDVTGKGIRGIIDGRPCYGGSGAYMEELGVDVSAVREQAQRFAEDGKTPLFFACETELLGVIAAADTVKETSAAAIRRMKADGCEVIMLTGDNETTANAVRRKLDLDRVIADVLPQDKERVVRELQAEGRKVIMVGDGINDSPALARADIGIAIGSGADIAVEEADVVLMKSDLNDVPTAIECSRQTMRNIKQNLFWAFFYNTLGIPLAAGALYPVWGITLNPMIGAAAMSLSSLFVVTNALRLYRMRCDVPRR